MILLSMKEEIYIMGIHNLKQEPRKAVVCGLQRNAVKLCLTHSAAQTTFFTLILPQQLKIVVLQIIYIYTQHPFTNLFQSC